MQAPPNAKHPAGVAVHSGWLSDLPITTKLAVIVVAYVAIMLAMLGVITACLEIASGVRAYVGAEGLWSKGQKDAVYYLARYSQSRDEQDYLKYQQAISIPLGDRKARLELLKPDFDYAVVERGFMEGEVPAADVPDMVFLFRHFGRAPYLADAIAIWTAADSHIMRLVSQADELHAAIQAHQPTAIREQQLRDELELTNTLLTKLERDFSFTLGEGARWIQRVLLIVILVSASLLLTAGLLLSLRISRELRSGILRLREGAALVAAGDLAHRIAHPSRDELGQLAEAFNTMVKHRQDAEITLKASMEEARAVIETAFDAFIGMDAEGRICDWNHQAEITFGWMRQEVLGQSLAERIIPPQHREAHQRGLNHYLRTREGPVLNRRIEVTALHRDGHEFPIEMTIWPAHSAGTPRFNAFLHDISDRHRMIKRLDAQKAAAAVLVNSSTLADAAPAVLDSICDALEWDVGAIWAPDVEAGVLRCVQVRHRTGREASTFSEISRKITFAHGIGLPGRVWDSGKPLWIPDVTQDSNFPRAQYAEQDKLHSAFAFPILNGKEVTGVIEFFSHAIQQPDDDLLRMMDTLGSLLGQFVARNRAESELAARATELARSNAELERFAYIASHDLQEPLRTVTSFTQLLARRHEKTSDPEAEEFIGFITESVQRMRELIEGLLAYSRVSRNPEAPQDTDLNQVVDSVIANLDTAIRDSGAVVTHDPLPVLKVNSSLIHHLLQNLVGNALKFRGTDPLQIHISAAPEGANWHFAVRDNGIGIHPQHSERIFVLFQRLHTRDQIPGNGLGLAICKKIVEQHGGRIWVEPASPGSIFHFTLHG